MYNYYGVPLYIIVLAMALRIMGFNLMTTFHEVAIRFNWRQPKYWVIAIFQRLIAYVLGLCSNKIIVSIELFKEMLKPFRRKIHRIPVGSNIIPVTLSREEITQLRAKIAPHGEVIISTFGAGAAWRRTDIMLQAINQFMKVSGRSVIVLILGSQGDRDNKNYDTLKQLINTFGLEKSVYLTGYLEPIEVFKHLSAANLFVLLDSDAYGGVGTKSTSLMAAYAAGLPIIGNQGLLTDSLLRHDENIYLIDSLDLGEIVGAITSLIDNQSLRQRLVEGSIKTYRDCLRWERIAKKHCEVLDSY
jgi:glycosyltransferase involved in cell wall biosynthesis